MKELKEDMVQIWSRASEEAKTQFLEARKRFLKPYLELETGGQIMKKYDIIGVSDSHILVREIGGDGDEVVWDDDCEDGLEVEDMVNYPSHYSKMGLDFECLDIVRMTLSPTEYQGFLKGNILKYLFRHESKNGLEDIEKMNVYATKLDSLLGGEQSG